MRRCRLPVFFIAHKGNMMKLKSIYCLAVLSAVTVLPAHAQSVRSEEQAIQRVSESVARNRLTSLKPECLMFMAEKTRNG